MAVPFINVLAPSMGGIGPIETADFGKLSRLNNGIPFYAGRFYPKKEDDAWINGLNFGLIARTPPWLTWDEIKPTQIWMVSLGDGEKIVETNTSIVRIDVWPRDDDHESGPWENNTYDDRIQTLGWGHNPTFWGDGVSIDNGIEIQQNYAGSNLVSLGAIGISTIEGVFTEYAFYDQELIYMNRRDLGQPEMVVPEGEDPASYTELFRVRADGIWKQKNAPLTGDSTFNLDDLTGEDGYPKLPMTFVGDWDPSHADYGEWVHDNHYVIGLTDNNQQQVDTYLNRTWDELTKWTNDATGSNVVIGASKAPMGQVIQLTASKLDTVVFTIKTSTKTLTGIPNLPFSPSTTAAFTEYAKANFADNLTSSIWYFYLPVKLNATMFARRKELLINREGIRKRDNPTAVSI